MSAAIKLALLLMLGIVVGCDSRQTQPATVSSAPEGQKVQPAASQEEPDNELAEAVAEYKAMTEGIPHGEPDKVRIDVPVKTQIGKRFQAFFVRAIEHQDEFIRRKAVTSPELMSNETFATNEGRKRARKEFPILRQLTLEFMAKQDALFNEMIEYTLELTDSPRPKLKGSLAQVKKAWNDVMDETAKLVDVAENVDPVFDEEREIPMFRKQSEADAYNKQLQAMQTKMNAFLQAKNSVETERKVAMDAALAKLSDKARKE